MYKTYLIGFTNKTKKKKKNDIKVIFEHFPLVLFPN